MLVFLLYRGKGVCLVKQMAMEQKKRGKRKLLQVLCEGVYTLCLSKLEPLAVRGLAHTYMAADHNHNSFQTLPISAFRYRNPQLRMFLYACVTAHQPAYVCAYIKLRVRVKKRKKKWEHGEAWCTAESLYVSPNWNTWLQIVGLFLMPPGCQVRLLSHSTWKVSTLGFPLPVCSYWDMTECFRMNAAAGYRGMHCLDLIVLPLCNQEGLIWRDGIFPDPIINNWTHFHDQLYFGFEEWGNPLLLMLNGCESLAFCSCASMWVCAP